MSWSAAWLAGPKLTEPTDTHTWGKFEQRDGRTHKLTHAHERLLWTPPSLSQILIPCNSPNYHPLARDTRLGGLS